MRRRRASEIRVNVYRYDERIQRQMSSKLEAKPWLHIAVNNFGDYAIYVWDTREIIETGMISYKLEGSRANDNWQQLVGLSERANADTNHKLKMMLRRDPLI